MDRTAWIVVSLCVIGLAFWTWYTGKQLPPRPAPTTLSATATPLPAVSASPIPSSASSPVPAVRATPSASPTPSFERQVQVLRNDDVELTVTNRGGGIEQATLLNHIAQGDQRVVLNSKEQTPIGAIIEKPDAPMLDQFTVSKDPDGSVKCEGKTADVSIRKKFFFPPSKEKKDNFLAEMDVDLVNGGAQPYTNAGYFIALGAAMPIHPKDYSYYTRLVWCLDGKAKGVDVNWFGGGGGFLGLGSRAPQPFYQQDLASADWAAVSDQFFTTLVS